LINKDINILALTATSSSETAKIIFERLAMVNVKIIGLPPERANIKYSVVPMPTMVELCFTLASELKAHHSNTPKTVVFCQTLKQCGEFHARIKKELGRYLTEPPDSPCIIPFRMVTMFTSASRTELRAEVLHEFCCEKTNLRIVIATTAFGLETGRAGRDGSQSEAILYYGKGANGKICSQVKHYGENKSACRRTLLFKNFLFSDADKQSIVACRCCDLCAPLCVCNDCSNKHQL